MCVRGRACVRPASRELSVFFPQLLLETRGARRSLSAPLAHHSLEQGRREYFAGELHAPFHLTRSQGLHIIRRPAEVSQRAAGDGGVGICKGMHEWLRQQCPCSALEACDEPGCIWQSPLQRQENRMRRFEKLALLVPMWAVALPLPAARPITMITWVDDLLAIQSV